MEIEKVGRLGFKCWDMVTDSSETEETKTEKNNTERKYTVSEHDRERVEVERMVELKGLRGRNAWPETGNKKEFQDSCSYVQ